MPWKVDETTDDEGVTYYIMRVAEKRFGTITGIREINEGKAAEVEFTWKYMDITPFGTAINLRNQQLNQSDEFMKGRNVYNEGQTFNEKVMFLKYDDGWRIKG
jgi:hypothetical protein